MLTREDNELLCQVGPGTPMGELMRRYWQPVLLPSELPAPDCDPVRIRLLGEDLVAFRDSDGRVGLLGAHCPHRQTELFFGRNEDRGLRCPYHGWKYDVDGNCVDMPSEPEESNFKDRVKHIAYPCEQRGGIIWTYMGPREDGVPPLPDLENNLLSDDHVYVTKRVQESNYAQAFEGGIDSAHASFLHSTLQFNSEGDPRSDAAVKQNRGANQIVGKGSNNRFNWQDKRPRLEAVDIEAGVLIGAQRKGDEEKDYWRVNVFLMPFYTLAPQGGQDPLSRWSGWVPMDDVTTMRWVAEWHPNRPLKKRKKQSKKYN